MSFRTCRIFIICLVSVFLSVVSLGYAASTTPSPSGRVTPPVSAATRVSIPPGTEQTLQSPLVAPPSEYTQAPSMITQAAALALVAITPYVVILLTAYIKIVVVLSILRNALGMQQSPPNQVINGLALILSFYVMYPTGQQMYNATKQLIETQQAPKELLSPQSASFIIEIAGVAKEPLRDFLDRNCQPGISKSFLKLANRMMPEEMRGDLQQKDFLVLLPSYIISQLKAAYEIGVLIYLPFFVIDIVTSNILLAMGMMMLSPLSISLPLKLLLLVMLDGWTVLVQGLVLTFR